MHDGSSHCAPQAPTTIRTLASSAVGLYLHRSPQIYPQFGSTTSHSTNTFSNNVLTRTFRSQNHPVPRVKHTEATCTGLPGGGARILRCHTRECCRLQCPGSGPAGTVVRHATYTVAARSYRAKTFSILNSLWNRKRLCAIWRLELKRVHQLETSCPHQCTSCCNASSGVGACVYV